MMITNGDGLEYSYKEKHHWTTWKRRWERKSI